MVDTASQKSDQHPRPTILLVDDDPVILMSLEALLAPLHCQIQSCANGKDAIHTAESLLPDLILLDIMLPEVDGYEVLEQLRQLPVLDTTPIVLMSALDYSEESFSMVVRELIDNAVKFHPKKAPSIQVDIRAGKDNFLEVAFMDDGDGVEPSKLAWMSQPYTQIEGDPTGNVPGVGLGLSTITLVVWEMGGWVSFENRTDQKGLMVKIGLKRLSAA